MILMASSNNAEYRFVRGQGKPHAVAGIPYFTDVPSNHVFLKYVQMMKGLGYTTVTGT